MSNTTKRILSAVVLIIVVSVCMVIGKEAAIGFLFVAGVGITHEIHCNFFKHPKFSGSYFINQLIFIVPFILLQYVFYTEFLQASFINACILLNVLLLAWLFYAQMDSPFLPNLGKRYPFVGGVFTLVSLMALAGIFHQKDWKYFLMVLLFINYGMDTGAWFFGKNFGKHKLWPAVSPNKTIEGFVGGTLTSGFLGGISWHLAFGKMSVMLFIFFCLLGAMSQVGDLIQSKLKRIFQIKDSSQIIPGHGGVYDRLDSLIYLTPFFVSTLKIFAEK